METQYEKLKKILRQMFQMDQADLDFGIYRIMNQKREEIEHFLDNELLPQVKHEFSGYQNAEAGEKKKDLTSPGYTKPLSVKFLKANPFLIVDIKFFDDAFKERLLASFDNIDEACDGVIINSENFQALNLLLGKYKQQMKCTYIDPPYNTEGDRSTGKFIYKDNYEHSSWLSMIYNRVKKSINLLKSNGITFTNLDENEAASFILVLFDIFNRNNYKADVIWNSRKSKQNDIDISLSHNHTLIFSMNCQKDELHGIPLNEAEFSNPDSHPRGKWKTCPLDAPGIRERTSFFKIKNPNTGEEFLPPNGRHWVVFPEDVERLIKAGDIVFGKNGKSRPQGRRFWNDVKDDAKSVGTIWDDLGTATDGTKELEAIFGFKPFETVKPTDLIKRIVQLSTKTDEIIMDYFAGSGTTAHAVIELNREDGGKCKYILIEMGQYFDTVLKLRIQKVVYSKDWKDGKPVSREGISHMFKYMKLESYEDTLDNLIIKRDKKQQKALTSSKTAREEYMLGYWLDVETRGSGEATASLILTGLKTLSVIRCKSVMIMN